MGELTSAQVWREIEKNLFGVIGMVTAKGEARTAGVVYVVYERKLYFSSFKSAWKVRHLQGNSHVSMTIPIAKGIPLMPFIKIPAATITFAGEAQVLDPENLPEEVINPLFRGLDISPETSPPFAVVEITPRGDFITYGVGVHTWVMMHPEKARGRVSVSDA